jgi:hypothetical protein
MLLKIFLAVFENRALGGIFGPKRDEVKGNGKYYTKMNFMLCIPHQFFFFFSVNQIKKNEMDGSMCYLWDTEKVHTDFLVGGLKKRDHKNDLSVHGKNNIKTDVQELGWSIY